MPSKLKIILSLVGGILAGAVYAVVLRLVLDNTWVNVDTGGLYSITFVWIAPIVIGITPFFFATEAQLKNGYYRVLTPLFTVIAFFTICFVTHIEDFICLLILGIPYMFIAGFAGLILGLLILDWRDRTKRFYGILFLPFVLSVIESKFPTPSNTYEVKSTVLINASADRIWNNVVRVKPISSNDYQSGFLNTVGIPRPLYAELNADTLGATRIGHFEGGLQFKERVIEWNRYHKVAFDITVIPASIGSTVFDKHILKGQHFKFLNAAYELKPLPNGSVELCLSSSYQLDSKVNRYGSYWGNFMLSDFQGRLLQVIKQRCEQND